MISLLYKDMQAASYASSVLGVQFDARCDLEGNPIDEYFIDQNDWLTLAPQPRDEYLLWVGDECKLFTFISDQPIPPDRMPDGKHLWRFKFRQNGKLHEPYFVEVEFEKELSMNLRLEKIFTEVLGFPHTRNGKVFVPPHVLR
jgi:hypothetical protein